MVDKSDNQFTFNISLSVLNHLGRNLYRSFATVLGEAISNSWDANARNVWIYIDKKKNTLVIKDDGVGMTEIDFQNKFLKIGYSKRKGGVNRSPINKKRPYIGRKGIGKLALLSCADKISVISKTKKTRYVGGTIDNSGLDDAITEDLTPQEYPLEKISRKYFRKYVIKHKQGTIIYFENVKDGIKNSLEFLKRTIALYFRFSLLDRSFNIFINGEKITHKCLDELGEKTQFLWKINKYEDPFVKNIHTGFIKQENEEKTISLNKHLKGFIASVKEPKHLKVMTTDEKVSVDLFVNGRLREKDILKHIPTARVVESYLYGQIHYDSLDDKVDRFTSSREGIVADDPKFQKFLTVLREDVIRIVLEDWDRWRRKHKHDGDPENKSITPKERKSEELFNVVSKEYSQPKGSKNKEKIAGWVDDLSEDAKYNFSSYAECFISENLIRKFIQENGIVLTDPASDEIKEMKKRELQNKGKGNISIEIRKNSSDLSYLSMDSLAKMVDKKDPLTEACLPRDANEYKPIRDALAHTALLTEKAKSKLTTVYTNIKDRINTLLLSSK